MYPVQLRGNRGLLPALKSIHHFVLNELTVIRPRSICVRIGISLLQALDLPRLRRFFVVLWSACLFKAKSTQKTFIHANPKYIRIGFAALVGISRKESGQFSNRWQNTDVHGIISLLSEGRFTSRKRPIANAVLVRTKG